MEVTAPFPPSTSVPRWRSSGAELTRRTQRLVEGCGALHLPAPDESDPRALVSAVQVACLDEIRKADSAPPRRIELVSLLREATRLADAYSMRSMIASTIRLADCDRGLARLREITTTAGLIDGVCDELIRSLGFTRTMLSRVEVGLWRPWRGNAAMMRESWVADWIDNTIPLDDLTLETRLLTERRPALILDTTVPGIASMVHAAGVRSYVAAPIMPGGQVVGFFHADHGVGGRTCDESDRDILWTFAEGFGHLCERTTLLEQLRGRAEQVRRSVSTLTAALDQLADTQTALAPDTQNEVGRTEPIRLNARLSRLTPRELEVLELVVAGARNEEIAHRLAIQIGTVKSHVQKILSKLGVLNRSQAIALCLGLETAAPHRA